LNRGPTDYESVALPAELHRLAAFLLQQEPSIIWTCGPCQGV